MSVEGPETVLFRKLEALLEERGLEFTPPMRFQYWNDSAFRAIFLLILELFDKYDRGQEWDPWKELDGNE